MDAVLEVDALTKAFGDTTAVDGVSFRIAPGETYGLLGPNGAGKTTTISMICGLLTPDSGTATVAGQAVGPRAIDAKRHIGLVPQDLAIYPDLTGRENLVFFGRVQGLAKPELRQRVAEVLEVVGLADRQDDRTDEYSGGMKRRLNIAIGLLHEPSLLVLDEPTVGVDPQSRNAILESVEALATAGMSVLYTTHYMEEAERLCDRIGIVDHGSIIAEGSRRELLGRLEEADRVRIEAEGPLEAVLAALRALPGVSSAAIEGGSIEVAAVDAGRRLPQMLDACARQEVLVTGLRVEEPDLETVFLHLTGRALRE